jgi:ketosteroid isomerase-like protein
MAPDHHNAQIARRLWEAISHGDVDAFLALTTPDVVWRARGENPFALETKGPAATLEFLANAGDAVDDIRMRVLDIFAGDHGAIVHYAMDAHRDRRSVAGELYLRLRIEGDRVAEAELIAADAAGNDAFWRDAPAPRPEAPRALAPRIHDS